jgi:hypothetical protein
MRTRGPLPLWEWPVVATKAVTNPATAFKFELYEVSKDWTQYTDVAAANPLRVQEMRDLMFGEFAKYQVLPLDASASTRFVAPRPSQAAGRTIFNYSGSAVSIPDGNQPSILNTSYTITADIDVPQGGAEGVIVDEGGRFYGYALYLVKGKPVFTYNLLDLKRTRFEGTESLAPGKHTIEYNFKYDGLGEATLAYNNLSGVGRGGTGTLKVDSRWCRPRSWSGPFPWSSRSTRASKSAPAAPRRWMTATIKCRSSSLARSTR